jgi:3-hydroxyacyl-[acyl-carrier-protein] dehydratase
MHFDLVDTVIERTDDGGGRIVTIKQVSAAEEYLRDHFPDFPVLPGVMMIEAMVQAARRLVGGGRTARLVLGSVRGVKYGRFVKPGEVLRVEVSVVRAAEDGTVEFRGEGRVGRPGAPGGGDDGAVAVSGRVTLRPVRLGRGDAA